MQTHAATVGTWKSRRQTKLLHSQHTVAAVPPAGDRAKGFLLSCSHDCLSSMLAQLSSCRDPGNPASSQLWPRSPPCPTSACKFPPRAEAPLHADCVANGSCCWPIPNPQPSALDVSGSALWTCSGSVSAGTQAPGEGWGPERAAGHSAGTCSRSCTLNLCPSPSPLYERNAHAPKRRNKWPTSRKTNKRIGAAGGDTAISRRRGEACDRHGPRSHGAARGGATAMPTPGLPTPAALGFLPRYPFFGTSPWRLRLWPPTQPGPLHQKPPQHLPPAPAGSPSPAVPGGALSPAPGGRGVGTPPGTSPPGRAGV